MEGFANHAVVEVLDHFHQEHFLLEHGSRDVTEYLDSKHHAEESHIDLMSAVDSDDLVSVTTHLRLLREQLHWAEANVNAADREGRTPLLAGKHTTAVLNRLGEVEAVKDEEIIYDVYSTDPTLVQEERTQAPEEIELASFLKDVGLEEYTEQFLHSGYDVEDLLEVSKEALDNLGVNPDDVVTLTADVQEELLEAIQEATSSVPVRRHHVIPIEDIDVVKEESNEIGRGFFGIVYKGKYHDTDVAVKFVTYERVPGFPKLDKWYAEVDILSELQHPHIVHFYGACTEPPVLCMVAEWAERGDLAWVLRYTQAEISYNRVLSFALDIAHGLNYLHTREKPIIHQDVKADNCLVTKDWTIKITDFGLSRYKDGDFLYEDANQSPQYDLFIIAPEVMEGKKATEKADVYSYSLILWELWARRDPFEGKDRQWWVDQVLTDNWRLDTADFPETDYTALMKDCWERDATKRPSFSEIITRLEALQFLDLYSSANQNKNL